MELTMTNGFCELNENEVILVDGGCEDCYNAGKNLRNGLISFGNSWNNFWQGVGSKVYDLIN